MAAILIFEVDISELFLKKSILFSINSIKVRFFANILIFRGEILEIFSNFFLIIFYLYITLESEDFLFCFVNVGVGVDVGCGLFLSLNHLKIICYLL